MRTAFSLSFLTILFLLLVITCSQYETLLAEKKKIILKHADTIEGEQTETGLYRSVIGNVVFLHDNITLKCDRVTDYGKENKIVLIGNVFISDNSVEIYGDNGVYYPDRKLGELSGHIRGRMVNNSIILKGQKAVVNKMTSQIWLYDNAVVWHEKKQISGDNIFLHIKEATGNKNRRHIDEIQVNGHAFFMAADTLSLSPVVYDQLSSRKMVIYMSGNSNITGITATTEAESLYHLYNENRKFSGINYSSGNMIRMFFVDGIMKRVKVTGHVEGRQYPERFRGDSSINLSRFAWKGDEQPFKKQTSLPW